MRISISLIGNLISPKIIEVSALRVEVDNA